MARVALILIASMFVVSPATAQSLALMDVTVIDVDDGAARPGQTVVVAGDRIAAVGAADDVVIPTGATVIDGRGKFLSPGLWDMHVHQVNDMLAPVPWDFHAPDAEDADQRDIYMPIYLAFGVTGVREMSGGVVSIQMRDRIERGELLGPHTVVGSPLLDGPEPLYPDVAVIPILGAEHVREVVTELEADGFDFLKPYSYISADAYRALHLQARALGMEVAGHVPIGVSICLAPLDALRTATINPARYLGREDDLGSIETGKIADLVLLEANPLEDIRNIRGIEAVVCQGHALERGQLDRMLEQLAKDVENWPK